MASRGGHVHHLTSSRVSGGEHLRSIKAESNRSRPRVLRLGQALGFALVFLLIFRALGQGLILGVAGAALVLLLQELVDSTPLFWSAPWEALQLVISRRHRVNHVWLHRTQEFALESIGRSIKADGFAMGDGFVLVGVGGNKQLVQWTADSAWRGMGQE